MTGKDSSEKINTWKCLEKYANEGLRTLVLA